MNFIPFDSKTGRIAGGWDVNNNFVTRRTPTAFHIPGGRLPAKGKLPFFKVNKEPTFSPEEVLLTPGEKERPSFVFYCDSVAGGKDLSGDGTKENPYRSLAHLMKVLFCQQGINLLLFLWHTKICIKIYLKGVVDYKVDWIGEWLNSGEHRLCYNYRKAFIISRWDDEALFRDYRSIYGDYIYPIWGHTHFYCLLFEGIRFQDMGAVYSEKCFFKDCVFEGDYCFIAKQTPNHWSDYWNCSFYVSSNYQIFDLDYATGFFGRYFKNCSFEFPLFESYKPGIDGEIIEDCNIRVRGDRFSSDAVDSIFKVSGRAESNICKGTTFDIELKDPSYHDVEDYNATTVIREGVECAASYAVDCTLKISVEHNFEFFGEGQTANLMVYGFGYHINLIRCHVIKGDIVGKNAEVYFCGYKANYSSGRLIDCTVSHPASAEPEDFVMDCQK